MPLELEDRVERGLAWLRSTDPGRLATTPGQGWWHGWGYGDVTGRMVEAFVLARAVIGRTVPYSEEEHIRAFLESHFGDDGLSWRPETPYRKRAAHMFDQSSVLLGLAVWYEESEDQDVLMRIEKLVNGLTRAAEWEGDWCRYPLEVLSPDGWCRDYDEFRNGKPTPHADPCHEGGRQITGLVTCFELTGYEPALWLAEGLTRFVIGHSGVFEGDGSYLERSSRARGHVHSRLGTALGVLRLGILRGDEAWLKWAKQVFDWSMDRVASSFGWVSERAHGPEGGSETCAIADALEIAVTLAGQGFPECWDVAERIVRNHLVESQCPETGGFSGHTMPNDYCWRHTSTGEIEHHVGGCCSPAGIRGLWLAWVRCVTRSGNTVTVNFPWDRESKWVEIRSGLPEDGILRIRMKDPRMLRVRLPGWVTRGNATVMLNDGEASPKWEGDYACFEGLRPGDEVALRFPVAERREKESFMGFDFDVAWRGNTVVEIAPGGRDEPLYRGRR